jgi:hypothetical protein
MEIRSQDLSKVMQHQPSELTVKLLLNEMNYFTKKIEDVKEFFGYLASVFYHVLLYLQ